MDRDRKFGEESLNLGLGFCIFAPHWGSKNYGL